MKIVESFKVDVIIIGAMKCGTTALFKALKQHNSVCASLEKEPNFFLKSTFSENCQLEYMSLFESNDNEKKLNLEASTSYAKLPESEMASKNIFNIMPTAKFIYVRRDPIERIVSHYLHLKNRDLVSEPLNTEIWSNPEYINFSMFDEQIRPYYDLFGADNILELTFDELFVSTELCFLKICQFLNIPFMSLEITKQNYTKDFGRNKYYTFFHITEKLFPNFINKWYRRKKIKLHLNSSNLSKLKKIFEKNDGLFDVNMLAKFR